jgi:hypothetical protein
MPLLSAMVVSAMVGMAAESRRGLAAVVEGGEQRQYSRMIEGVGRERLWINSTTPHAQLIRMEGVEVAARQGDELWLHRV